MNAMIADKSYYDHIVWDMCEILRKPFITTKIVTMQIPLMLLLRIRIDKYKYSDQLMSFDYYIYAQNLIQYTHNNYSI